MQRLSVTFALVMHMYLTENTQSMYHKNNSASDVQEICLCLIREPVKIMEQMLSYWQSNVIVCLTTHSRLRGWEHISKGFILQDFKS
jgi:hypothetical protein